MNNSIQALEYEGKQIRTEIENDNLWFNANDVCNILGFTNPWKAISDHVHKDDLTKREVIDSLGRQQESNYVNEPGLYSLIFGSRLPEAQRFKRWVFEEVLPSIRKTGEYRTQTANNRSLYEDVINYQRIALDAKNETLEAYKQLLAEKDKKLMPNIDYGFKTYRKWTEEEDDKLTELVANGKTRREIASIMDRTVKSIQFRIEKIIKEG